MKQPIAGVAPPALGEVTIMTVWPSIAATGVGRFLGRRYESTTGFGGVFTLGNLWAALTIPLALVLFFLMLSPFSSRRYRLTNRRLIIERGIIPKPVTSVSLDDFDAIDIQIQPGQAWYPAGDLIFRKGTLETFRIYGVPRPETFKQVCLKAQRADASVKSVMARQPATV